MSFTRSPCLIPSLQNVSAWRAAEGCCLTAVCVAWECLRYKPRNMGKQKPCCCYYGITSELFIVIPMHPAKVCDVQVRKKGRGRVRPVPPLFPPPSQLGHLSVLRGQRTPASGTPGLGKGMAVQVAGGPTPRAPRVLWCPLAYALGAVPCPLAPSPAILRNPCVVYLLPDIFLISSMNIQASVRAPDGIEGRS